MPPARVLAPLALKWPALRAAHPSLSWVAPERWHITLAFLGEVSAGQRHRLSEGLKPLAAATAPIPVRLAGSGAFPGDDLVRVLWVGVLSAGLDALAAGARAAAFEARIPLDQQAFRPHITIARARHEVAPSDVPHLLRKLAIADGTSWEISSLALLASSGGPRPSYTELAAWSLTGLVGDADAPTDPAERP